MILKPPPAAESTAWPPLETAGRIRASDADFFVAEELGFQPDGEGQHLLLLVRKAGGNTQWVARRLARFAGTREREVGYSGLKDRRAVTEQWFSIPAGTLESVEAGIAAEEGVELLRAVPHRRKLRRGSHAANRFRIVIRDFRGDADEVDTRLALIGRAGVPNYFGPQRFGRDQGNLTLAARLAQGHRLRRRETGFALSAARSLVFNQVLAQRIAGDRWRRLQSGDVAMLHGSRSIFCVDEPGPDLDQRLRRHDIHPSGPLWGTGELPTRGGVAAIERAVAQRWPALLRLLEDSGLKQERRSLRLTVGDLDWERDDASLVISFRLPRGGFATSVLREILPPQTVAPVQPRARSST